MPACLITNDESESINYSPVTPNGSDDYNETTADNRTASFFKMSALSFDDEVQAFKKRELERLHLGYIIPILEQEAL
jgi:hypothetical protein